MVDDFTTTISLTENLKTYTVEAENYPEYGQIRLKKTDRLPAVCRALESVPGALHAQADHTRGVATLEAEAPLDEEALRRAVAAEDYEVKEIMRETV